MIEQEPEKLPTKRGRGITVRAKKLIKGIVAGKTLTQAAIDAGYKAKNAAATACVILKNDKVEKALNAALERAGITEDAIAGTIAEGLKANKADEANHDVRHKFAKLACELRGDLKPEESNAPTAHTQILNIILDSRKERGLDA